MDDGHMDNKNTINKKKKSDKLKQEPGQMKTNVLKKKHSEMTMLILQMTKFLSATPSYNRYKKQKQK